MAKNDENVIDLENDALSIDGFLDSLSGVSGDFIMAVYRMGEKYQDTREYLFTCEHIEDFNLDKLRDEWGAGKYIANVRDRSTKQLIKGGQRIFNVGAKLQRETPASQNVPVDNGIKDMLALFMASQQAADSRFEKLIQTITEKPKDQSFAEKLNEIKTLVDITGGNKKESSGMFSADDLHREHMKGIEFGKELGRMEAGIEPPKDDSGGLMGIIEQFAPLAASFMAGKSSPAPAHQPVQQRRPLPQTSSTRPINRAIQGAPPSTGAQDMNFLVKSQLKNILPRLADAIEGGATPENLAESVKEMIPQALVPPALNAIKGDDFVDFCLDNENRFATKRDYLEKFRLTLIQILG